MRDKARNFIKELSEKGIDLLDFIILADVYNQLNIEGKVELRTEAYERRFDD